MTLTEEQKEFLDAEGHIILCATPGSGKTFIVAKKINEYLKNWQLSHRGIAALSFTNVASSEIANQIDIANIKNIEYPHFIGTIDSFIDNYIFLRFGYLIQRENRKRPIILQENNQQIKNFYWDSECYKKGCVKHLEWFRWSSKGLLKKDKPIDCTIKLKKCVKYKKEMLQRGFADQGDVPALSLILLQKYPQISKALAYRFPIIIVDEAQDTSFEQMQILDCIAEAGIQTIILVGDPDQALYEWRNATPEYFKSKMKDNKWKCMYLTNNFRNSQLICNATQLFSSILKGKGPCIAKGEFANCDVKPILLQVTNETSKEDIISFFLNLCQKNKIGISSENIAVLTRKKLHSDIVTDLWKTIETELLAKASFYWHYSKRKEAYKLCEKVIYNIEFGNMQEMTDEQIEYIAESTYTLTKWKSKIIKLLKVLPQPTLTVLEWKYQMINGISKLISDKDIKPLILQDFNNIVKIKSRDNNHPNFLQHKVIDYFEKKEETNFTVSSVHGVKGETFEAILLIVDKTKGANTLTPNLLNTCNLDNELIRIAYVAMTRPRKLLVVSMPKTDTNLTRFPQNLWNYQEM